MPHNLLSEAQISATKEVVEQEAARFLENLPQFVESTMKEATLGCLGIREERGYLRFLSNGSNWLKDYVDKTIHGLVDIEVRDLINETLRAALKDPSVRDNLIRYLQDTYRETVVSKLKNALRIRAEQDAQNIVEAIADKLEYIPNTDLNDPECYQGPIGEILLEQIAKGIVEEEDNHGVVGFDGNDWTVEDEIPF